MQQPPSPIRSNLDFDADGVRHGHLSLPHSHDTSAWGSILIPLTVVRNGDGPTALLTGANHGDEFEGPVALFALASTLRAEQVSGRVIIVPAMNYPAFLAGTRTSPIDRGNLNRSFPGRPDGSVTEKIADYFQRFLLPLADYVLDIHAGGKTLDFVPFAAVHRLPDEQQQARCVAAMKAFGAPYGMLMTELDNVGMYDTAAEQQGKVFVSTELGGGGSASAASIAIAHRGVRNFLRHAGILEGDVEYHPTRLLDMAAEEAFHISADSGLLEMCVDLGQPVTRGSPLARVFDVARSGARPEVYTAAGDGILAARHFPGLIQAGDCLAVIARPIESD